MMFNQGLYIPRPVFIKEIIQETADIKTFKLVFSEKPVIEGVDQADESDYLPGQFVQVAVLGKAEAPISICSSPTQKGFLEIAVKKAGLLTRGLHTLAVGDQIGIRGPYGNHFPLDKARGKNIIFIAGGIGLAPLRGVINYAFAQRLDFGRVSIFYGSRTENDLVFTKEYALWRKNKDTDLYLTVDKAEGKWNGPTGVVTALFDKLPPAKNSIVFICGPVVMIKFVVLELLKRGFAPGDIILTLERHMQCGVGKCGHCYLDGKYVCVDGPVFSLEEIKNLQVEEASAVLGG